MRRRAIALVLFALLPGCKPSSVTQPVKSAGEAVVSGARSVGSAATSLVNVNLSNVLNDLALQLHVDRANIPINAQIPITIAANVCGVSINILSVSTGGTSKGCTAVTVSPELTQAVQQQMATGGSTVSGQTTPTTTTPTTTTPPTTTTQPPTDTTTPPKLD